MRIVRENFRIYVIFKFIYKRKRGSYEKRIKINVKYG